MHTPPLRATRSRALNDLDFPSPEKLALEQEALVAAVNGRIARGDLAMEAPSCLCGSEAFVVLATRDRYGIAQTTVACRDCGLVQSRPRMTAEASAEFYSSDLYRKLYNPDLLDISDQVFLRLADRCRHRHDYIIRTFGPPRTVLEVGCGGGWNLLPFCRDGAHVTGVDPSPSLTAFGRARGMDLRTGDLETVDPAEQFDVVIVSHVMEHFPDPVERMRVISHRIRPGGALYVEVPDVAHFCLGGLQSAHNYYFSRATLERCLGRSGLVSFDFDHNSPHMRGMFRPGSFPENDRDRIEFEWVMTRVRAYDRRELAKDALSRLGLLAPVRGLLGRIARLTGIR